MKKFRLLSFRVLSLVLVLATPGAMRAQFSFGTSDQQSFVTLDNLVQGRIYAPDYQFIKGNPYLLEEWVEGSVHYREQEYHGLSLRFDVFADELVMLHRSKEGLYKVQLTKAFIRSFTLSGRQFINMDYSAYRESGLGSGFYEVVFEGRISLLAKRTAVLEHQEALAYFIPKSDWRLVKDGRATRIRNKKSLLAAVGEQYRKPIALFLREQVIILRKADDVQWLRLASHLNTLLQSN